METGTTWCPVPFGGNLTLRLKLVEAAVKCRKNRDHFRLHLAHCSWIARHWHRSMLGHKLPVATRIMSTGR
jgi:hypothetical protein